MTSPLRRQPELAYLLGAILCAIALSVRMLPGLREAPAFATFIPALVIAALLGNLRAGIVCAVGGGLAGWYFFIPPYGSFALENPQGVTTLVLYALVAAIILSVIHVFHQLTERLRIERDRSATLFQELQHRVANNMSMVAAVLRLQRKELAADNGSAAEALDEAQRRIETIGRIHRRLYDPATVTEPVRKVLGDLCLDLLDAGGAKNIVCTVNAPNETFDLNQLLPLSLIVTEAVTNAMKYAFEEGRTGTISIELNRLGAEYELRVADDGQGIASLREEASGGLGTRLVRAFAQQLGGRVEVLSEGRGTTVLLRFPA